MRSLWFVLPLLLLAACRIDPAIPGHSEHYKTRQLILVSVDGPRWSETWGDSTHQNIPHRYNDLRPLGTLFTNFQNNGVTKTIAGHTAMITGIYQTIDNDGLEHPLEPAIFQYWRKETGADPGKAWIVSSKDKMSMLADCYDPQWQGHYTPEYDCGVNGSASGYREDSITYRIAIDKLKADHPALMLLHFREPDFSAHTGSWDNYIAGIKSTDEYVWQLWNFLQTDPFYSGTTSLLITNDHGRHLDGIADGFAGHGDACAGCRHIELLAIGPDFKAGAVINEAYELTDLPVTIGELLHFQTTMATGRVIWPLFK